MNHLTFKATKSLKGDGRKSDECLWGPKKILYQRHLWFLEGDLLGCWCLYRIHNPVEALISKRLNYLNYQG